MRRLFAAAAVLLALLAGCAQGGGSGGTPPSGSGDEEFDRRAAEVAAAWRASSAAAGRDGFVPLGDLTVLPKGAGFSNDTKLAYGNGWFRSTAQLSTKAPPAGSIRFSDGKTLSVPLVSAADAYRAIDKGDPPCTSGRGVAPAVQPPVPDDPLPLKSKAAPGQCTALTVTGAKLGTVALRTNRGEATVPAWLFTVDEIAGPVARVAVAPPAIETVPSPDMPMPGHDSVTVDGARLTYSIITGCAKDIVPLAYEAEDVVVVGVKSTPADGACPAIAKVEPVTVTLTAPLGDRVVLNSSGHPLRRTN
jgi:hypothetical protein